MTPPAAARGRRAGRSDDSSAERVPAEHVPAEPVGRDLWEEFFENVPLGLALADRTGRYLRLNRAYADVLGRTLDELVGVPFREVLRVDLGQGEALVADLLAGRRTSFEREERYVGPAGSDLWVLHGVSLVRGEDGEPRWFALTAQNVSERRRAEQELRDLTAVLTERAVRDPLTGLANRTLVEERLRGALARDARTGGSCGVLFLDLDGFKAVNDRYGHAVGDAVLQAFAARLTACVRPSDTVARLGGDEFVVLAEGTTLVGLQPLVERLTAALAEPVEVGTLTLQVGVSVGVAMSAAGEADAASLIKAADQAMYLVKRDRRAPG